MSDNGTGRRLTFEVFRFNPQDPDSTPHMQTFQAAMGERPPASLDVKFYEVEEIHPL